MRNKWRKRVAAACGVAVITMGSTVAAPDALARGDWGVFFSPTAECIASCPDPEIFPCCVPEPLPPIIVIVEPEP